MKRIILSLTVTFIMIAAICAVTANAEAVPVQVTANEAWTNATFDPDTGYLTNIDIDTSGDTDIDRSYSLKVSRNASTGVASIQRDGVVNDNIRTLVIPASFIYDDVNYKISFDNYPFGNPNNFVYKMTRLVISDGITKIPVNAFPKQSNIVTVKIYGNTLQAISDNAFNSCSALKYINLPDSLETIGPNVFNSCNSIYSDSAEVNYLTIPAKVTKISNNLFKGARALRRLYIKGNVTVIEAGAFANYTSISSIFFEGTVPPSTIDATIFTGSQARPTIYYPANRTAYTSGNFMTDMQTAGITNFSPLETTSAVINNASVITVSDPETEAETDYYRVDFNAVIGADAWTANQDAVAILGLFNGNELVAVKTVSLTDSTSSVQLEKTFDATHTKLFVLGSVSSAKPLAASPFKAF